MLPIIEVPPSIRQAMKPFRPVFGREEGFEHVSRKAFSDYLLHEQRTVTKSFVCHGLTHLAQ